MNIKIKGLLAKVALFSTTIIWGSSFFLMKNTVNEIEPFYLLAVRFTAASIILAIIFFKRLKFISREYIIQGSIMGSFLFLAYVFQTIGLTTTTPGKNAFLTTTYVVIVPFLYWIYPGKKPKINHITASVFCIIGIGFVSLNEELNIGIGDILTIISGLFYAMHMIVVAEFSRKKDIFALTILQFMSAAVLSWICGLLFNKFPVSISSDTVFSLLYLCIFATSVALLLQNVGQKYTHASAASIILSLESVFGVIFSIIFYHEVVTLKIAIGFVLIFIAVILSEFQFNKTNKLS